MGTCTTAGAVGCVDINGANRDSSLAPLVWASGVFDVKGVVLDIDGPKSDSIVTPLMWAQSALDAAGIVLISTNSLFIGRLRFRSEAGQVVVEEVVGILSAPFTEMAISGMMPVPVAAMMAGSAFSKSH